MLISNRPYYTYEYTSFTLDNGFFCSIRAMKMTSEPCKLQCNLVGEDDSAKSREVATSNKLIRQ